MKQEKLKFAAVMMIAVFLFSLVPLAFADEGSDDAVEASATASAETDDVKVAVTTSERVMTAEEKAKLLESKEAMRKEQERIKAARAQSKEAMEQEREKLKAEMEIKREAMKDSIEAKREEMKQVRELSKENLKSMMTERKEFMEKIKVEVKERHDTLELARKAKKEGKTNETINRYKEYLVKSVDHLTEELEHAKENIAEKTELLDSEKSEITTAIDAQIASLASLKAEISAATTKDQLKEVAKKLADSRAEHFRRYFSLRVLSARIQVEVNRAEVIEKRLETLSEKAKAKKITKVVFDRGGFLYAGRVKALADAARAAGLVF